MDGQKGVARNRDSAGISGGDLSTNTSLALMAMSRENGDALGSLGGSPIPGIAPESFTQFSMCPTFLLAETLSKASMEPLGHLWQRLSMGVRFVCLTHSHPEHVIWFPSTDGLLSSTELDEPLGIARFGPECPSF